MALRAVEGLKKCVPCGADSTQMTRIQQMTADLFFHAALNGTRMKRKRRMNADDDLPCGTF